MPAHAVKGVNADGTLDKKVVSQAYFEGEFWTVITALETFRKSGVKCTREDSVYTFKYLSVIYAADATTRNKAESYMYQLLKMMPTIDLLDLYISDNIESIFKKVKNDYDRIEKIRPEGIAANPPQGPDSSKSRAQAASAPAKNSSPPDETAQANSATPQPQEGKSKSGIKPWVPITIAGVGVVAASVTYLVLSQSNSSNQNASKPRPVALTVVTPNQGSQ